MLGNFCSSNIWGHGLFKGDWPEKERLLAKQQWNICSQLPSSAAGFDLWWCLPAGSLLQLVIWLKGLCQSRSVILSFLNNNVILFSFVLQNCGFPFPLTFVSYVTLLSPLLTLSPLFFFSQRWCHPRVSISLPFVSVCTPHIPLTLLNTTLSSLLLRHATFLTSAGDRVHGSVIFGQRTYRQPAFNSWIQVRRRKAIETKQLHQWSTQSHSQLCFICWKAQRRLWWYQAWIPVWYSQMSDADELAEIFPFFFFSFSTDVRGNTKNTPYSLTQSWCSWCVAQYEIYDCISLLLENLIVGHIN